MRVGIDGSNLRMGGGVTHLVQLLEAADPSLSGVHDVTVWGARRLLDALPSRRWLRAAHEPALEGDAISRFYWQQRALGVRAAAACDILFSPGSTYLGPFRPFVTMFRNMLPFNPGERRRYGVSRMAVKLACLQQAQAATLRRASGVIALSDPAAAFLTSRVRVRGLQVVIPHGVDPRFHRAPGAQPPLEAFSAARPFRWLYVSAIHPYKNQPQVALAVAALRAGGAPVSLDLVGPAYARSAGELAGVLRRVDPGGEFISVRPAQPHDELPGVYQSADGFVFASTCENMPNTLLEAMASGLPIGCSDRAPMPHIVGDGAVYFDARDAASIAGALSRLLRDHELRSTLARAAWHRAQHYSWDRCAHETFEFLRLAAQTASHRVLAPAAVARSSPSSAIDTSHTV